MKLAVHRTSATIAALATAGVSSLFLGATPASAAPSDACGDGTLIAPGVCEQTFTSGTATFTPAATMTKLEVLLVGAGGEGADQPEGSTNGYAAGGGGGEVKVVDFSGSTAPIELSVAAFETSGGASDGTIVETVANGNPASFNSGTGGASGSGFSGAVGGTAQEFRYGAGGGAGASPTTNQDGGAGVTVAGLVSETSLFAGDDRCFGGGGAVGVTDVQGLPGCGAGGPSDATGLTLFAPAANSGGGGGGVTSTQPYEARAGADGFVAVRWNGATVSLAFSASGRGVAPATQTVVAGTAGVRPADPTATGFDFAGWYTDAELTSLADFSAPLTASTTYYASWIAVLPATGDTTSQSVIPLGLGALVAGLGLFAVSRRRKPEAN